MFNIQKTVGYHGIQYNKDNNFHMENIVYGPLSFNSVTDCVFDDIMKADILVDDDKYTITIELPGVKKEDIKVHWNYDLLTVEAFRGKKRKKNSSYYVSEITYGELTRSFGFVYDVDKENVDALYENGILTVIVLRKTMKKVPIPVK